MMKKGLINWNIIFVILCVAFLLTAGCSKKQIIASPTDSDSGAIGGSDSSAIEDLGDGARNADAVRQQRLQDMEYGEGEAAHGDATIYFDYDSAELSADAQRTLKKVASDLQSNPSQSVDISGHCDERGTIEYNLALGEKRARAAKKFLVAMGISGNRISCISYGEERPIDPQSTESAWAKNRRDEFVYIK